MGNLGDAALVRLVRPVAVILRASGCGRCGKEDCVGHCPEWTVPADTRCGTTWVGDSRFGNEHAFITDESGTVVAIPYEDLAAVAFELLRIAGVKVPRA